MWFAVCETSRWCLQAINSFEFVFGLCKTNGTKNLQKKQTSPTRPPPNKFEGATLYFINNTKLNSVILED